MTRTIHRIFFRSSLRQSQVASESVDLVITSPPYPMIEMWDDIFADQDKRIRDALDRNDGFQAFEFMHGILDSVWKETFRVLKNGGFACINIGDATRTLNDSFVLYPNHSRIVSCMISLGFTPLPDIIWRKQTNAPNRFMGSGMLPAGAYVTLEHEYILIFRKGGKRVFSCEPDRTRRRESAFFWEERNIFFSDIWFDIKGAGQGMKKSESRLRSAAFPFELAYRLIAMYSVKGDTVLDPFMGTGTTMLAAMASARNSTGFEIDGRLRDEIHEMAGSVVDFSNNYINKRIGRHLVFVENRIMAQKEMKYTSSFYGFPVITNQEKEIIFNELKEIHFFDNGPKNDGHNDERDEFEVVYFDETVKKSNTGDADDSSNSEKRSPKQEKV